MKALISRNNVLNYSRRLGNRGPVVRKQPKKGEAPSFANPVCVVDLGYHGDVLHTLPALEYLSKSGEHKPTLVVNERCKTLAEAITYANVRTVSDPWHETPKVVARMRREFKDVMHTYTPGGTHEDSACGWGFMEKVYKGFGPEWHEKFLAGDFDRITIDKRNPAAESALIREALPMAKKPLVLVNTAGISSPFKHADRLLHTLRTKLAPINAHVVDISNVRAKNFHDMLGLFDAADFFVGIDSGLTHLAGAHGRVPYIGMQRDTHLYRGYRTHNSGGYMVGNCVARFGYSAIEEWLSFLPDIIQGQLRPPGGLRVFHVHLTHDEATGDTRRRNKLAEQTWKTTYRLGNWTPCPVRDRDLDRFYTDGPRRLPYVRDVIDFALPPGIRPSDMIFFTNADTCFAPSLSEKISELVLEGDPLAYFIRREFHRVIGFPVSYNGIHEGGFYAGTDGFLFPVSWWRANRMQFPDMLIAREAWDAVLRQMLIAGGGREVSHQIYHEAHAAQWSQPGFRYKNTSNLYNLALAKKKFNEMSVDFRKFGIA